MRVMTTHRIGEPAESHLHLVPEGSEWTLCQIPAWTMAVAADDWEKAAHLARCPRCQQARHSTAID